MSPDGLFVFVADYVSEGRGRVEEDGKESARGRDEWLLLVGMRGCCSGWEGGQCSIMKQAKERDGVCAKTR